MAAELRVAREGAKQWTDRVPTSGGNRLGVDQPRIFRMEDALQRKLQQARGGNTRMDPLKLGRPPVFTGDEATYED
eukprot:5105469-Amphidinium_carterae.1